MFLTQLHSACSSPTHPVAAPPQPRIHCDSCINLGEGGPQVAAPSRKQCQSVMSALNAVAGVQCSMQYIRRFIKLAPVQPPEGEKEIRPCPPRVDFDGAAQKPLGFNLYAKLVINIPRPKMGVPMIRVQLEDTPILRYGEVRPVARLPGVDLAADLEVIVADELIAEAAPASKKHRRRQSQRQPMTYPPYRFRFWCPGCSRLRLSQRFCHHGNHATQRLWFEVAPAACLSCTSRACHSSARAFCGSSSKAFCCSPTASA